MCRQGDRIGAFPCGLFCCIHNILIAKVQDEFKEYQFALYLYGFECFLEVLSCCRTHAAFPRLWKNGYPDSEIAVSGAQQVVDFEMPDEAAANNAQRKRRRRFYLQNGHRPTGHFLSYLGVDYEIFCMEETLTSTLSGK